MDELYGTDKKVEFTRGELEWFKGVAVDFLRAVEQFTWENPSPAKQTLGMQAVNLREYIQDLGTS